MGMSAMRVMDVAMILMRGIAVFRHMLTNDSCVRGGMVVMMMPVIAMIVRELPVIETR
jgi:hypothetical protein